jgi:hypothetical protein
MTDKKKEEKKPLDLTTEEAMKALFPQEAIDHLNKAIQESDAKKSLKAKSARKHDTK